MLERLRKIVLWSYPEQTSVETLLRHKRWAKRIVYAATGASVLMFTSMVEFMLSSEGLLRTIIMAILLFSLAATFLLIIPMIRTLLLTKDIENALRQRGVESPFSESLGRRVGVSAMKMCFWAIILVCVIEYLNGRS
jgi:hypothetical protein